jgi:hypothetical protein
LWFAVDGAGWLARDGHSTAGVAGADEVATAVVDGDGGGGRVKSYGLVVFVQVDVVVAA